MLDIFYTVDVEVWCDGWDNLDANFADSYRRHIHGQTAKGDFGLPLQLKILNEHGLQGVFFVEPLFALRFGAQPLQDIVGLLKAGGQDVQLHLHTEWLDEAHEPLLPDIGRKRQFLRNLDPQEQHLVIGEGLRLLCSAGADQINAFRAGNFGFNVQTLPVLAAHGLRYDSSYNACVMGLDSGLYPDLMLVEPIEHAGILEYPVTVYRDGLGRLRPMQITACSWGEMEGVLWAALESGRKSVVIVSHSFELLDGSRTRPDPIARRRFESLCRFIARNRDCFRAQVFGGLEGEAAVSQPPPLQSSFPRAAWRLAEQGYRRIAV